MAELLWNFNAYPHQHFGSSSYHHYPVEYRGRGPLALPHHPPPQRMGSDPHHALPGPPSGLDLPPPDHHQGLSLPYHRGPPSMNDYHSPPQYVPPPPPPPYVPPLPDHGCNIQASDYYHHITPPPSSSAPPQATIESLLSWMRRLEARLEAHEQRWFGAPPPPRPDPDPLNGMPLSWQSPLWVPRVSASSQPAPITYQTSMFEPSPQQQQPLPSSEGLLRSVEVNARIGNEEKEKVKRENGEGEVIKVEKFRVCDVSMTDFVPNLESVDAISKGLDCLVPRPKGYKLPHPWPKSRDEVWFDNVRYTPEDNDSRKRVSRKDDQLMFKGGGSASYQHVDKMVPEIALGQRTRVALDFIGSGVSNFGAFLIEKNVLIFDPGGDISPRISRCVTSPRCVLFVATWYPP